MSLNYRINIILLLNICGFTFYNGCTIGTEWQRSPESTYEYRNEEKEKTKPESDNPSTTGIFKQVKDFVYKIGSIFMTFVKQPDPKTDIQKPSIQMPLSPERKIPNVNTFVSESNKQFAQTQKNWQQVCDELKKNVQNLASEVDKEELPEAIQESKKAIDESMATFAKQLSDEQKATTEKLSAPGKKIEDTSSKTFEKIQDDTKKILEKSNEVVHEMQRLLKQKIKVEEEDVLPEKGKFKPFNPEPERKAKIDQGRNFVADLVKNPERVAKILPSRPPELDRLLNLQPGEKISTSELLKMQNNPDVQKYLNAYLAAIESIGEHFLAVAKQKAPDYSSGTIVIEDKNGELYKFLRGYVEITNKLENGPSANINKPSFIAKTRAYCRLSSHFDNHYKYGSEKSKRAGKPPHYGIDLENPIKTETGKDQNKGFIGKHLLFGKIQSDSPFMFIKFERNGLGNPKSAAIHGLRYIKSRVTRTIEKVQAKIAGKKKDLSEGSGVQKFEIKDRRERIPKIIYEEYKNLLKKSKIKKEDQQKLITEVKVLGIAAILKQIKEAPSLRSNPEITAFKNKIKTTYQNDNLDIRMGNEIIVRDEDLQKLQTSN